MHWIAPCVAVLLVLAAADGAPQQPDYEEASSSDLHLFGRRRQHIRSPLDDSFLFPEEEEDPDTEFPRRRPTSSTTPSTTSTTTPGSGTTQAGCECPTTPEFNPVCGTDGVTYSNPGKLKCARYCGKDVELNHHGNCITTKAP